MVNTLEPAVTLTGEKRVTLHNLSWESYQQILSALPQTRAARLTYDGRLEISVPSEEHEFSGRLIERFIRILVVELGMKLKTMSNTDINKNHLYASMGVPEFWRFNGHVWRIFQLEATQYREVEQSPTFPQVEKADFYGFLAQAQQDEVAAEVAFRQRVREMAVTRQSE